ncbi:MAG: sirohydrochlorin chelatase [Microcoleaceae cyanobacterium]
MQPAYFLVSHGSRDPQPQLALQQLAKHLEHRIVTLSSRVQRVPVIGTGTLECAALSLSQQIQAFSQSIAPFKLNTVKILPLFLFPGVHVQEDIPTEVIAASQGLDVDISLELLPYLGSKTAQITQTLQAQMQVVSMDAWILMGHGSRRLQGNQPMELLATQLAAIAAYWSMAPSLDAQVQQLVQAGVQKIGIFPYFIFSGGITQAIQQSVTDFAQQFPQVQFHLAEPLDQSGALLDLTWEMLQ